LTSKSAPEPGVAVETVERVGATDLVTFIDRETRDERDTLAEPLVVAVGVPRVPLYATPSA